MVAIQKHRNNALSAAIARLMEQYEPVETRLFNDPLIKKITSGTAISLLKIRKIRNWVISKMDRHAQGVLGGMNCRTRYFDELTEVILQDGFRQILVLNAGMDTRAHRLKGIDNANVFELDMPEVLALKREKILDEYGTFPAHLAYIPFNFYTQNIEEILKATRFDFSRPTFIIWESGTQYLPETIVEKALNFIGKTAPGSHLAFTYILKDALENPSSFPGAKEVIHFYDKQKTPWVSGMKQVEIPGLLQANKLCLIEDIGEEYYQEYYLGPMNRKLPTSSIERVVFAKVCAVK